MNEIMTISGVECYEQDGVAYLELETVARGLGFTQEKNGVEYIKWERVSNYLKELGFSPEVGKGDFIPENIFYRLAMKAKNETAEKFQAKVADEIIPSIRKHGAYMTPGTLEQALLSPDFLMQLAQKLKEEMTARKEAEMDRDLLCIELAQKQPMVDYFQACVEQNMLTNLRETAKLFSVGEKEFIQFLIDNRFLYRGRKGKLLPYATREDNSLFEVKEVYDEKTGWKGIQTFVTPRGRETLRLLIIGKQESGMWGRAMPEPREMTEREELDCEAFYERQAKKRARKTRK